MSQRERPAGGTIAPVHRPVTPAGSRGKPPESAPVVPTCWEDLYASFAPDRQVDLLELAGKQGFVFSDQLPTPTPQPPPNAFRSLLNSLRADSLSVPNVPLIETIAPTDPQLDLIQRDVVGSALQSPDLFLIQGLPGTGKTRVVGEILRQATRAGQRVLLLAPRGSTADAVLASVPEVEALRVLGRDEHCDALSPAISMKTLATRERDFKHQIIAAAQNEVVRCRERLDVLQALFPTLDSLPDSIRSFVAIGESIAQSSRASENLSEEVRRQAEQLSTATEDRSFLEELRTLSQKFGETLASLDAERTELQKQIVEREELLHQSLNECEQLRPLLELREQGRWWSFTAWKAKRDKTLPERCAQAEARWKLAEETLDALVKSQLHVDELRCQADAEYTKQRTESIEAEIARRQAQRAERESILLIEQTAIALTIESAFSAIATMGFDCPAERSVLAVEQLREQASEQLHRAETDCVRAMQWQQLVDAQADRIAQRMRGNFSLVAGPMTALSADTWFANAPGRDTVFDLVIVDDAHRLTELECVQATGKGKRWVFIGEPALPYPEISQRFRSTVSRPVPVVKGQPDFFFRLWNLLHREVWVAEGDRLCCRLHSVSVADRSRIDREFVADQPDIELRILTPEHGIPTLAEIVFPERMSLAEAKEYLFREVGEIAAQPRCRSISWQQENDTTFALFEPTTPLKQLPLEAGVKELLCKQYTVGFAFDCARWERDRITRWLEQQLSARSTNRTATLATPYRAVVPLAAWLNEAAYHSPGYAVSTETSSTDAIQFEAVPERFEGAGSRSGRHRESRNGSSSDRHHRGGAGLEMDLSDPRQRGRLPSELATLLPAQGLVNLAEARAISDLLSQFASSESIVVTATSSPQITLLRHFAPRPSRVQVQFLTLEEVAHQESDVLIISLTRSHLSRAVTYGDDPLALVRAMTRVRRRIVLVGDPGTLARRAQWEGAVDHLDEVAGERERTWVKALLRHVPSRVLHPTPARVPEGVKA